jgi:sigma-B regulation protein RsbU (phosphoserine phosphatase)
MVGGDFYDFINVSEDHLGIAIGDAQGKGMPGALLMATVRSALRTQIENSYTTQEIMYRVNNSFCRDTRVTNFVTLFYGALNTKSGLLTFTNAGHSPPLLFRGDSVQRLEAGGLVVGIQRDWDYSERQIALVAGDVIVLYTDGAVECMNRRDEMFGTERLIEAAKESLDRSASEINDRLYSVLRSFLEGGALQDDLTLLVLKVTASPPERPLQKVP